MTPGLVRPRCNVCFYEGWCAEKDIATAEKKVEKLVKEIASLIKKRKHV